LFLSGNIEIKQYRGGGVVEAGIEEGGDGRITVLTTK